MTVSSQLLDGEAIQVLKGVVPPIAATTAALLLAWRPWRRPPHTTGRAWGATLGLVLGFFAAFVAVKGYWPPFPALAGTDWFPYVGIAVAVVGLCVRTSSGQIPRRAMVALTVLASWLMLRTMWTNRWHGGIEGVLHVGISSTVLVVLSLAMAPLGSKSRGPVLPLALTLICSVASFVLLAGSGASMGQLAGALAAGLGVCTALGFCNREFTLHASGTWVVAMLLGCLLLGGHYFNNAPPLHIALVVLSMLCTWVDRWGMLTGRSLLVRGSVVLGIVAAPLVVAGWLAWQTMAELEYY